MTINHRQFTSESQRYTYRSPFCEDGAWRARRRDKLTGRLERITLSAETHREARLEIQALAARDVRLEEQAVHQGATQTNHHVKLGDALEQWLSTRDVKPNTLEIYGAWTARIGKLLGPDRLVREITYEDLETFFAVHLKTRRGQTKMTYRGILIRFFDWCVKHGYCEVNHAQKIELQKQWRKEVKEAMKTGKALTLDEARRLLEACKPSANDSNASLPPYLWWVIFIALRTGLRHSNITGNEYKPPLRWGDVNLDAGTIFLCKEGMKNNEDFFVPIHEELREEFKNLRSSLGRKPSDNEPIVTTPADFKRSFRKALRIAKLENKFRFHDLRHTFASWLGEFCPHAVMQKLLGHTATTITDRYTQHQTLETLRSWLNKLPWLTRTEASEIKTAEKVQ